MTLGTLEHETIMENFEREFRGHRLDREDKSLWSKQNVYQNGETNALFLAYRRGFSLARSIHRAD